MVITPPLDTIAGTNVSTLQLFSENYPDLALLDLVYLQIPQQHLLQSELRILRSRVLLWDRPWWQLMPLLILSLLSIGASVYLIWWSLFRVPPPSKIIDFYSEDNSYEVINNDVVHLGFSVSDVNRLQTIKITGMSTEGKLLTRPNEYNFGKLISCT